MDGNLELPTKHRRDKAPPIEIQEAFKAFAPEEAKITSQGLIAIYPTHLLAVLKDRFYEEEVCKREYSFYDPRLKFFSTGSILSIVESLIPDQDAVLFLRVYGEGNYYITGNHQSLSLSGDKLTYENFRRRFDPQDVLSVGSLAYRTDNKGLRAFELKTNSETNKDSLLIVHKIYPGIDPTFPKVVSVNDIFARGDLEVEGEKVKYKIKLSENSDGKRSLFIQKFDKGYDDPTDTFEVPVDVDEARLDSMRTELWDFDKYPDPKTAPPEADESWKNIPPSIFLEKRIGLKWKRNGRR